MGKRSRSESDEQLGFWAEWCRIILKVEEKTTPQSDADALFGEAVSQAVADRNLRGLKMIARDLTEWAKRLPSEKRKQVDDLLRSKLGKGLAADARSESAKVQRVLEKGEIETEDDYRTLLGRADSIYADESKRDELERINAVLAKYHKAGGNPGGRR
jgi:hypothetical protein